MTFETMIARGLCALAVIACPVPVFAAETGARAAETNSVLVAPGAVMVALTEARPPSNWDIAVYGGVWTNSTLPGFPGNLVTGKLTFEDSGITSLIVHRNLFDFGFAVPGTRYRLDGFTLAAEWTLDKHFGLQDHVETTLGLTVRTGEISLGSHASMNLALTNGLSAALTPPKYELGPTDLHGVDSRRVQYFMAFETAVTPKAYENLSVFVRLHHRSGIYGVISPRKTGSNFVGAGLRWTFH